MQANNIQHVLSSYCEPGTILRGTCGFAVNKKKPLQSWSRSQLAPEEILVIAT